MSNLIKEIEIDGINHPIGADAENIAYGNSTVKSEIEKNKSAINILEQRKVNIEQNKGLSSNDYTDTEKDKLAGIAEGAEVNQNAFSKIKIDNTTITADNATDTLTLVGSNVTITPDTANDKITIGITQTNVTNALGYTPPAKDTTYSVANQAQDGLMSKEDKQKIDKYPEITTDTSKFLNAAGEWAVPKGGGVAATDAVIENSLTVDGYVIEGEKHNIKTTTTTTKSFTFSNLGLALPFGDGNNLDTSEAVKNYTYIRAITTNDVVTGDFIAMIKLYSSEVYLPAQFSFVDGYTMEGHIGTWCSPDLFIYSNDAKTGDISSITIPNLILEKNEVWHIDSDAHIQGKYSDLNKYSTKYAHVVGGGTSESDRKNIHTLDWNGNAEYEGKLTIGKELYVDGFGINSYADKVFTAHRGSASDSKNICTIDWDGNLQIAGNIIFKSLYRWQNLMSPIKFSSPTILKDNWIKQYQSDRLYLDGEQYWYKQSNITINTTQLSQGSYYKAQLPSINQNIIIEVISVSSGGGSLDKMSIVNLWSKDPEIAISDTCQLFTCVAILNNNDIWLDNTKAISLYEVIIDLQSRIAALEAKLNS